MPKMRFKILYNNNNDDDILYYTSIKTDILMCNIKYTVIDDIKYYKPNCKSVISSENSINIYKFYKFIRDNDYIVNEIVTNDSIYRLKNRVLHNEFGPSYINIINSLYFINGNRISYEKWLIYNRQSKLKEIISKI